MRRFVSIVLNNAFTLHLCKKNGIHHQCVLNGRVRFKEKIFRGRPLKTPTALALDHFDFYYGPSFREKWPSIRLGLLTPHKYIAVINRFASSSEVNEEILKTFDAFDIMSRLVRSTPSERMEKKKKIAHEKAMGKRTMESDDKLHIHSDPSLASENEEATSWQRNESSLLEFRQPTETISTDDICQKHGIEKEIIITGYEGQYAKLSSEEDFIVYPRELKLYAHARGSLTDFPVPMKDEKGVPSWWLLDGGSVVPVLALDLAKDDVVLDMCAAPGGKSLLILQTGLTKKLVCNDFKLSRLGELRRSLSMYVPSDSEVGNKVFLKRKDGTDISAWDELNAYDKVLVDASCSTDRHSLSQDDGNIFSTSTTNERLNLPLHQTRLLINALRSVKIGGSVVYSTCTLSSMQNEGVVENAVAICANQFGIECVELKITKLEKHLASTGLFHFHEKNRIGSLITPFLPSNFGPTFICKLLRII